MQLQNYSLRVLDHVCNDKQGRNNLIKIARAASYGVSMRNPAAHRQIFRRPTASYIFRHFRNSNGTLLKTRISSAWSYIFPSRLITYNIPALLLYAAKLVTEISRVSRARVITRSCELYALSRTLISAPTLSLSYCSDRKSSWGKLKLKCKEREREKEILLVSLPAHVRHYV